MKAYVIGSSALHFWRRCENASSHLSSLVIAPLSDCPRTREELESIQLSAEMFGRPPFRLMTSSMRFRPLRGRYNYSLRTLALPETAFCQVSEDVCVASPEYCLLQSAQAYPRYRLMELCMELCGNYALDATEPRGFVSRSRPLTTLNSIATFLKSFAGEHHVPELDRATKHVQEGSWSPMETCAFMLLCLPKRYGGYGLPRPAMNARVELSKAERAVSARRYLVCDMLWPQQRVVVEYDGNDDHASFDDRAKDATKKNILTSKGYVVFTLTAKQILGVRALDKAACEVAKALRFQLRQFPKSWALRRDELRRELFRTKRALPNDQLDGAEHVLARASRTV